MIHHLAIKEKTIIDLMILGHSAQNSSMITGSSIHTINNQKNRLIKKFGCETSTKLAVKLIRLGYVEMNCAQIDLVIGRGDKIINPKKSLENLFQPKKPAK